MSTPTDYIDTNKKSWNQRTTFHLESDFYDMPRFRKGGTSLNTIEQDLLGDVRGKSILHLQCHFGQDSLSLARMGAKVTGIDLSDTAIAKAKELNTELGLDAEFICCNIYDLPLHLHKKFDLIYTSYGAIVWLPDMEKWAKLIADYLNPGGTFVLVEFHPALWMFDPHFKTIQYSYFNAEAIQETESGTYADRDADVKIDTVTWNHSLGEVMGSLLACGLEIKSFQEYDYSPYNCIQETEKIADRKYRIRHFGNKLPMVYSLSATKK
jgi:2-polyprenyl-3-methyl-5-hydroxy-6-metoxy-1,4-benzoquinol methylase